MTGLPAAVSTSVADTTWVGMPSAFRPYERTVLIGDSDEQWRRAADAVVQWGVKTRSGFTVHPVAGTQRRVVDGADYTLTAAVGPFRIREPVRVISVVDVPDRRGFAYRTQPGHPVTGEEAFIVHRGGWTSVVHAAVPDRAWTRPVARGVPAGPAGPALVPPPLPPCHAEHRWPTQVTLRSGTYRG